MTREVSSSINSGEGVGLICAAFHPRPVLVRLSDFKSNEYRELLGGWIFEPVEENPMIAWRGASRYMDDKFKPAFEMEIEAMKSVKQDYGLDNLQSHGALLQDSRRGQDGHGAIE